MFSFYSFSQSSHSACGNYLNGGNNQRGQADGFNIEILSKLKDVKTKDNFSNLLKYVVRYNKLLILNASFLYLFNCRKYIDLFDEKKGTLEAELPVPEPGDLDKARTVDFDAERAECEKLKRELKVVKNKVATIGGSVPDEDREPFQSKMNSFLSKAQSQVDNLDTSIQAGLNLYHECMKFYKFSPKKGKLEETKPVDFFDPWYIFSNDFKNVWKQEQNSIKIEMLKQEKLKKLDRSESMRASIGRKPNDPSGLKNKIGRRKSRNSMSNVSFNEESLREMN